MSDIFDFEAKPDQYAVMGNPIAHSKSPVIHSMFAAQTEQNMVYSAIHVDLGGFEQAVGNFSASGGKGLNITVPFKQEAWALADKRSNRAERAGAVNTLRLDNASCLYGDNTDGIGLVRDLTDNRNIRLTGARILLMGAGGAARGVLAPLLEQQPRNIIIANRTAEKAKDLAQAFSDLGPVNGSGYEALNGKQFDLIINATAASLKGEVPPLPENIIAEEGNCYDMMYGSEPTAFMHWCTAHGASHVYDGLGMLVEQAAESFYLWRNQRPDTQTVIDTLRKQLSH